MNCATFVCVVVVRVTLLFWRIGLQSFAKLDLCRRFMSSAQHNCDCLSPCCYCHNNRSFMSYVCLLDCATWTLICVLVIATIASFCFGEFEVFLNRIYLIEHATT